MWVKHSLEGTSKYPKLKRNAYRQSFTVYDGNGKVTIRAVDILPAVNGRGNNRAVAPRRVEVS